jgi:hypothetical protein
MLCKKLMVLYENDKFSFASDGAYKEIVHYRLFTPASCTRLFTAAAALMV